MKMSKHPEGIMKKQHAKVLLIIIAFFKAGELMSVA